MKTEFTQRDNFHPSYVLEVLGTTAPDLLNQTAELRRVLEEACHALLIERDKRATILHWYNLFPPQGE